jgi:hypothetical protein
VGNFQLLVAANNFHLVEHLGDRFALIESHSDFVDFGSAALVEFEDHFDFLPDYSNYYHSHRC